MLTMVPRAPGAKRRTSLCALLLAALASGPAVVACEPEAGPCELSPAMQVFEDRADVVRFAERGDRLFMLAAAWTGVQWHPVAGDGRVGSSPVTLPDGLAGTWLGYADTIHVALPWNNGFRLVMADRSVYVAPGEVVGRIAKFVTASPVVPNGFRVDRVFVVDGAIFVVWVGRVLDAPEETWVAGLGRLDANDRVAVLGEPFYRGPPVRSSTVGLQIFGGWDPDERCFWIDHPDEVHVLKIGLDGTQLGAMEIVWEDWPPPYLLHWTKLSSGRWAGLHGSGWCLFTPTQRRDSDCRWLDADGSYTLAGTQYLDRAGRLWIALPDHEEVAVWTWNDSDSVLSEPVRSPLAVQVCGFPSSLGW